MGHPPSSAPPSASVRLPFVGRADDLTRLRAALEQARAGRGGALFLTGEGGVGKSRLAATFAGEARHQSWTVAEGRAYAVEAGVPYALFSDALLPTLQELGRETLAVLTRGVVAELELLFPLLRPGARVGDRSEPTGRPADANLQLYWTFAQFLKALAARRPLLIVVGEIGLARQRLVHGRIAVALESAYGPRAGEHTEELALHFAQGAVPGGSGKAARYLAAAGRSALARFANREAADHLSAAVERLGSLGTEETADAQELDRFGLVEDLARARQRLGEYEPAIALWGRAREDAARRGDALGVAAMERRIGLSHFWTGRHTEALAILEQAAASAAGDSSLLGRIRMARGVCLSMVGRGEDAHAELGQVLEAAEQSGDLALLSRVHRALLLFHAWSGAPEARGSTGSGQSRWPSRPRTCRSRAPATGRWRWWPDSRAARPSAPTTWKRARGSRTSCAPRCSASPSTRSRSSTRRAWVAGTRESRSARRRSRLRAPSTRKPCFPACSCGPGSSTSDGTSWSGLAIT